MRIVLTGTYNSANKGDAAMQWVVARKIATLCPDATVIVMSPFPKLDDSFYSPIVVAYCNRRRLIVASLDLLRAAVWRVLRWNWLLNRSMRLVRDADLVVDLSGDMLTDDYGPHVAYSHYLPILRARILGRPYFLCAQSIGPFKLTRRLARSILEGAAAITPRDEITLEYLSDQGIRNNHIEQTADLAFLLEPAPYERATEILRSEGIALDDRPLIGVSISHLIGRHYRVRNRASEQPDFFALMKTTLERLIRERDLQILFVPHVTGPSKSKDDRLVAAYLRESLRPNASVHAIEGDYRPHELKALIGRCTVFCGARMHANIGALSSGVPTVAISYSHKTPGIMSACGADDFVMPIESASVNTLAALIGRALDEREQIAALLAERIPEIERRAMRNIDILGEIAGFPIQIPR